MKTRTKQITRSDERMHTKLDWLDSRHSFSFGGHHDPDRMGFGPLRVVNDDWIAPGGGFSPHPHRDMEIVSLVLDGQLEHKDSMGNGGIIPTGAIQYMSAGSGVVHSEFNPSPDQPTHLMQIWIEPNAKGLSPRYAEQPIIGKQPNQWHLILSPDGRHGSMAVRQDVELHTVELTEGGEISYRTEADDRGLWLFVIGGDVEVDGATLGTGDSLALSDSSSIDLIQAGEQLAKVMLFDLPIER